MDSKAVRFSVPPEGGENEGGGHAGRAVSGSPSLPTTDGSDAAPRAGGGGGSSSSDLPASSTSSPSTPGTSFWDEASADHPPTTRRSRTPLSGAGDSPRRDPWHPAPDEDPAKQRGDAALAKQVRELELRLAVQETEASALRAEAADLRLRIGEYKRQTYSDDTLQAVEEEVAKVISDGDRDLEALRAIKDEELRMLRRNHSADLEDLRRLLCAQESRASAASAAAAALLASPVSLEDPFGVLGMLLSLDVDLYQKKNFLPQPCDAAIKQAVTKLHDASQAPGEEVLSTRSMDAALASAAQLEASKRRIRAAFERQASEARSLRAAALSEAPAFRAVREGLAAELSGPGPAADFSARFQEYVNLQAAFEDRLLAFARETEHAFDEHLSRDPQTHNLATIARAPQADGGLESIPEALRHRVRNDPLFRLLSASDSIFAESVAEMIRENLELKATRCVRKSPQSDREALERRAEAAALEDHCTRLHLQCAALEGQKAELRGFKQRTERELAALTDAAARLRRAAEEAGPPSPRPSVRFSPDVRPPGPQPPPPPPGPPDAPSPVVPPTPLPPRNALPDDTSVQQQRNPTPASRPPSSPGRALVALPGAAQPDGGSDDTSSSSSVGSTLGSLNGRVFCDFDPSAGIPREHLAGVESLVEDPRPQGHPADASRHSAVARQVLAAAARKDAHVASLAEFILRYLQQGAAIHRPVAKPAPRLAPLFARLSQDRAAVLVFSRDPAGGAQQPQGGGKPAPPPPAALVETVPLRDVVGIALGQGSEAFHKVSKHLPAPDGAVDVNSLHKVPKDTAGNITPENKGLFFYRSLTLHLKKGKTLDFVAASDSDFESWVFALARLTGQVPAFGAPLDSVRSMRGFDTLRSEEKQFCQVHHLPPLLYLNARLQCLQQANATWLTLYDIRTLSGLDLLHAQKVFDLWHGLGWIDRQTMSPIRYLEKFPGEASSLVDVIDAQRRRDRRRDVENTQNRGWE